MVGKRIKGILLRLLCMFLPAMIVAGCVKENMDDCDRPYSFTVKAYGVDNRELTSGEVSDVALYIFDAENRFAERIDARANESVTINVPPRKGLYIVAWGNLSDGNQVCTLLQPGDPQENGFVRLLPDPYSAFYSFPPGDLFWGEKTVLNVKQSGEIVLPVYRKVGSMTITLRRLETITGYNDTDYAVVVRGDYSEIDFSGRFSGNKASYRPTGSYVPYNGQEVFYVPPFHMIPQTGNIYIDIYRGSQLVASVSESNRGDPIAVREGMLTNVWIDLNVTIDTSVSLTPWGEEQMWKEF